MSTDKKISELPIATSVNASDISVLVDNGIDYQYNFTLLQQFLEANISTGANISFGTVLPQNISGNNGDVFINTALGSFAQKVSGSWSVVYTLLAANAADGTLLYGTGLPGATTGKNSDSYINTLTGIFYQKSSGTWVQVFSMATGPQGPQGVPGINGTNGTNGNTILFGTTTPSNSTTGINGNFYINTSNYTIFGPKTAGIWGSGVSILGNDGTTGSTGPQGATGSQGPAGATGVNGAGVASGGTTGQVLAKIDNTDYHTQWITPSAGGGTPGGTTEQLQYNNAGVFAGSSKLTFDGSILNVNNAALYLGAGTKDASALFQADSTSQGIIFPRMTEAERLAITSPAIGLQVYQTDAGGFGEGCYQYRSTGWVASSGGVGGTSGQIQFNGGGSFSGSSNFTYKYITNEFYVKIKDYGGYYINSPNYPGIVLQSNGTQVAYIGGGQSSYAEATNDISIIGSHWITFEASQIKFIGTVTLPNSGYLGIQTNGNIYWGAGAGHVQMTYNYGSSGQYFVQWQDAGNHYTTPQNSSDMLISSGQRIVFDNNGGDGQKYSWLCIDNSHKSLIINGGSTLGFIADTSALLQLDSISRGLAFPQMTSTQKNSITLPRSGLVIYDTDLNKLCVYTSAWQTISSS